jgi:cytochrome c553
MKLLNVCIVSVPLALVTLSSTQAATKERLFAKADIAAGKSLHQENNCTACHQQRTGKNDKDFYTRIDRKVKTQEKLISQIAYCSSQLNLSFFPEDELNIAAYLNDSFYKLK